MSRSIRIGLIAEGDAELGQSVPYIKPEEGGKVIEREREGALHTLIRRELAEAGFPDCDFVHRHPSFRENTTGLIRTGRTILDPRYIAQVVVTWQPTEIDMVVICADSDDQVAKSQEALASAVETSKANHFDAADQPIPDRSVGGLAIKNFDTWLLADSVTVANWLNVPLPGLPEDLETLPGSGRAANTPKRLLDAAILQSDRARSESKRRRKLVARWQLAFVVSLAQIKNRCQQGYGRFADGLRQAARRFSGL